MLLAIALFYAIVCTPVYLWSSSDVLVRESVFPQIWDFVQSLTQFLFYWIMLAFCTFLAVDRGLRGSLSILGWYAVATVCMNIGAMLVGTAMLGNRFEWDSFTDDLLYAMLDVLLMLLIYGISFFLIWLIFTRVTDSGKRTACLPFVKLADLKNRLQLTLLVLAAVPSVLRLISRLIYDLYNGAPQNTADLLWMIFFYLADFLSIAVGYLVLFLLVDRLNRAKEKKIEKTVSGNHF